MVSGTILAILQDGPGLRLVGVQAPGPRPRMKGSIVVGEPLVAGQRVVIPLSVQGKRARQVVRADFWSEYSFSLDEVPAQILTIPAVAHLLPLSWAEDFDLTVSVLDRTYLTATDAMRSAWRWTFPEMSQGGRLHVDHVRETAAPPTPGKSVILFGGGVDSVASALLHESEGLTLFTVWGLEVGLEATEAWRATRRRIETFANRHHASMEFVKTNAQSFLDRSILDRAYEHLVAHWWRSHSGQGLLAMAAPIAVASGARVVYIPATHTAKLGHRWGTSPSMDEAVAFGHVQTIHDGYDLSRFQKLRLIHDRDPAAQVRVCISESARTGGNCGYCEKCVRTAAGFRAHGIDPENHGVHVPDEQFDAFRRRVEKRIQVFTPGIEFFWRDIQENLPPSLPPLPGRIREFLLWLRDQDLSKVAEAWRYSRRMRARRAVGRLVPHRVRPLARRVYLRLFRHW